MEADSERALYSSYVLPANAVIPALDDDLDAVKKLDANDPVKKLDMGAGQRKLIPLRTGYAGGNEVQYWDLGPLTAAAVKPMFIFQRRGADSSGLSSPFTHLDMIDAIPGDAAYSPLRQLYVVYVDKLSTERITSVRALEDAVELGLVSSPLPTPNFMDCIVTSAAVDMQAGPDGALVPQRDAYYQGKIVKQFCIGDRLKSEGVIKLLNGQFTPGNAYLVRRQNEGQPLDEQLQKRDLNDDGDTLDADVVFDAVRSAESYTGVWKNYDVIVPRMFAFGDARAESDLFNRMDGVLTSRDSVVDYKDTATFLNRPLRGMP